MELTRQPGHAVHMLRAVYYLTPESSSSVYIFDLKKLVWMGKVKLTHGGVVSSAPNRKASFSR